MGGLLNDDVERLKDLDGLVNRHLLAYVTDGSGLMYFYDFVKETSHRVSLCFSVYFVSLFVCSLPQ
jgi:hypothetical protein